MRSLPSTRVRTSAALQKVVVALLVGGILTCSGGGGGGYSGGGSTAPPTFTLQPSNQTTTVGRLAAFTVGATGATSYQWQGGSSDIPGATGSSYSIANAGAAQNGATFRAVASNQGGSVTSNAASLTVNPAISFTTQPAGLTVSAPAPASFSIAASGGTAPLTYQWQRNGIPIVGATGTTYTLVATSAQDNGATFSVTASDVVGATAASATVILNVSTGPVPTITQQPSNKTTTVGRPATITVVAAGAVSYQWQNGTTDIPGATAATYTVQAAASGQNGTTFRAIVSNPGGSTTSNSATLTVNPVPTFTVQPVAFTALIPASATFTATVSGGTLPLALQWQRNGTPIPSATTSSYTLPATSTGDSGATFALGVTDAAGATATSAAATLTTVTLPATFQATVMLLPVMTFGASDTTQVLSMRTQLEADGFRLASNGSLLLWPESVAAGWRVDFGSQHTLIGVDGSFTLSSPSDGAQFATLTHPAYSSKMTRVTLAQLASVVGTPNHIVIPEPFIGPCGMSAGDDFNCSRPQTSAPALPGKSGMRKPGGNAQACAGCPPKAEPAAGVAPSASPNSTCRPTMHPFNRPRQIVYPASPDGIRGSYFDPFVTTQTHCVISDGYITTSSELVGYLGSTCDVYISTGACPTERDFSDAEYQVKYGFHVVDSIIGFFGGQDIYAPPPKLSDDGKYVHCFQNHKGRNCAMVCIGDLSCDFTADHHIVHAGESYGTYIPYGGTSEPFVVHNNGVYGITQIVKIKDDIGGLLTGGALVWVGVDQEIHHYRPLDFAPIYVLDPTNGEWKTENYPTAYFNDESLSYTPSASAPPGAEAIYRFMVDNQQVTITFIIGPYGVTSSPSWSRTPPRHP